MKKSRWIVLAVITILSCLLSGLGFQAYGALPGGTLDLTTVPKYTESLLVPPAMPKSPTSLAGIDYYEIAVRQFQQQMLPAGLPSTTVWGYGSRTAATNTFSSPAYTIEATVNKPVRVKWINDLKDPVTGNFLPHLLPVDQTLHWANPGKAGGAGIDSRPPWPDGTPGPYTGPVPQVVHLHGSHVTPESDGYPSAWMLPNANDLGGFVKKGTKFDQFDRTNKEPGSAVFQYANDQRATTLWFHDHTLGMTRLNVYAGPAGFYLLRGGPDDLSSGLPSGNYEVPLVVQDKSFNADGSLFFPDSRAFFDGFTGPFIPDSDIAPLHNPEFFGNTMVVNGKTWPAMEVEKRRYRFRLLNACNARFVILKLVAKDPATNDAIAQKELPVFQIGGDGGFLPKSHRPKYQGANQLLIAPAERADIIIDFSSYPAGTELYLANLGPDEPFGGGAPGVDFAAADPATTGQVMKFVVKPINGQDDTTLAHKLILPTFDRLPGAIRVRKLSLNEADSAVLPGVGPMGAFLGTMAKGNPVPKMFGDPLTEITRVNWTEKWEIYNFTADAHPIHLHQVQFEVIDRQRLVTDEEGLAVAPATLDGPPVQRETWERGTKDTVIVYPGMVTRLKAKFDLKGLYLWHCHIIDHEDNEMMRPILIK